MTPFGGDVGDRFRHGKMGGGGKERRPRKDREAKKSGKRYIKIINIV